MKDEFENLDELQAFLNQQAALQNATSKVEIDNLSPNDMHLILYQTLDKESPLSFREDMNPETIEKIPFVKLSKEFLAIIEQHKELKLTAKGNLPPKICKELYGKKILVEDAIESGLVKLSREADSLVIQNLKIVATLARLIKKRKNKLSLTKLGKKIIDKKLDVELFQRLFTTYSQKFNLGFHDGYPQKARVQFLFGYTLYLLLQYGKKERDFDFYVEKNILAFPHVLEDFSGKWSTPKEQYTFCYKARIFDRFMNYFGFTMINKSKKSVPFNEKWDLKTTEVFQKTFKLNPANFRFIKNKNLA